MSDSETLKRMLTEALTGEKEKKAHDTDIIHKGSKIILPGDPEDMDLDTAVKVLERKSADEKVVMEVDEKIECYPLDGLHAFHVACKEKYGWVSTRGKTIQSFFGSFDIKPSLMTIKTGPNDEDSIQVPIGDFLLPGVENVLSIQPFHNSRGRGIYISGEVKKKEMHVVQEIANLTRAVLKEKSIYKGKAIRLQSNKNGSINFEADPEFRQTANIVPSELILNDIEERLLEDALWSPILNTQTCIDHKIPLNRGVLLEGTFGTGKTMAAHVTSKICVDNGWTYIVLDDVRGLKEALLFAQAYQPAVVFAEDVDRVLETRDDAGNDLLNTIDGVLSKSSQVITVLTTNFVEKLDRAMLRPGRLDAVVSIRAPESDAVQKLVRLYARGLLDDKADISPVGKVLAGNIPATIREVVERTKLGMVTRGEKTISADMLLISAEGMTRHLELLNNVKREQTTSERLGEVMMVAVSEAVGTGATVTNIEEKVIKIDKRLN